MTASPAQTTTPSFAIVGMGTEFPGAQDGQQLWRLLESGLNMVSSIPQDRFDSRIFSESARPGSSNNPPYGNFLDNVDAFDNAFFHISPREARSMDPQQRLLLRTAYHALEDAGYVPNATPSFNPDSIGVYVGVATNDYVQNLRNDIDVYYSTGTLQAFLAGKISYAFQFGGPSFVVDTACSSSLVAIHQACRALMNGDCNAAIAGGVNTMSSPDMYVGLARGHFLSETGQCRPWDSSADGYCRSEGCGLFVLKRLEDAVAENDRILGIIRGVELNQSGNARSITHPHVPTHVALYKKLVEAAGIHPHAVNVVECHGTGTQAGDPTELEGIRAVLSQGREAENPLYITSIKANIGHTEAASGAASLAKLIMMMRERTIPRHPSFQRLNPRIRDLSTDHTRIPTTNTAWDSADGVPRRALLNNFGASGSNGALILEEHIPVSPAAASDANTLVIGMSCKSVAAAEKRRAALLAQLEAIGDDPARLQDFTYTTTARRQLHPFRISASGRTSADLLQALRAAPVVEAPAANKVVFVFSGQGAQHPGMGAELYARLPFVAELVDECDHKLVEWGFAGLRDAFRDPAAAAGQHEQLEAALFVLEYSLAMLWRSWGIEPCAVVGHSFGEYPALAVAGVLSVEDALWLVAKRARLVSTECTPGETSMVSVKASAEQVEKLLESAPGVTICCYNSATHFTVGGPIQGLEAFTEACAAQGIKATRLTVPYASHSAAMTPVAEGLRAAGSKVTLQAPTIPILSGTSGTMSLSGDSTVFTADYFARHFCEPLKFHQAIVDLQSQIDLATITAFVELGPHTTTVPLLRDLQRPASGSAPQQPLLLASLRKNTGALDILGASLAQLYSTSAPVRWRDVFAVFAPGAKVVDLPLYPFAESRFWVQWEPESSSSARTAVGSSDGTMSPKQLSLPPATLDVDVNSLAPLIKGHTVTGAPLCPASVYAELVFPTASSCLEHSVGWDADSVLDLVDFEFSKPLVYSPDQKATVHVDVVPFQPDRKHIASFAVSSYQNGDAEKPHPHCAGYIKKTSSEKRADKFFYALATVQREVGRILSSDAPGKETFSTRTVYELLFPQIVIYSKEFHTIKNITIDRAASVAYALLTPPTAKFPPTSTGPAVDPIFSDTLFHVAGFLINFSWGLNGRDAYICTRADKLAAPQSVDWSVPLAVFTSVVASDKTDVVADAYAVELDSTTGLPKRVVASLKRARFRKVALAGIKRALGASSGASAPQAAAKTHRATAAAPSPAAARAPASADVQGDILKIVADTSGLEPGAVTLDAQLARLGIDSLMIWELVARLRALLPAASTLDTHAFAAAATVRDLVRIVTDAAGTQAAPVQEASPVGSAATLYDSDTSAAREEAPAAPGAVSLNAVKSILSAVLDIPVSDVADDAELESLGLDSLASIEARHAFKTDLGAALDDDTYLACRTVKDIFLAISRTLQPAQQSASGSGPELVRLQRAPSATTHLVLVHDGSGLSGPYSRLESLGCDVWAIQNVRFDASLASSGNTLVSMATRYVRLIKEELLSGNDGKDLVLGGWSFGGVVAYEIAQQLAREGINRVKGLVLIDSPEPQTRSPLPDALLNAVVEKRLRPASREAFCTQMRFATRALVEYAPAKSTYRPRAVILRSRERSDVAMAAGADAALRGYFAGCNDAGALERDATAKAWKEVLGTVVATGTIPGDHFGAFDDKNTHGLSEKLKEVLVRL